MQIIFIRYGILQNITNLTSSIFSYLKCTEIRDTHAQTHTQRSKSQQTSIWPIRIIILLARVMIDFTDSNLVERS